MDTCSQHGFLPPNSHTAFTGKGFCKFLFMQQEKIPGFCHSDTSFWSVLLLCSYLRPDAEIPYVSNWEMCLEWEFSILRLLYRQTTWKDFVMSLENLVDLQEFTILMY